MGRTATKTTPVNPGPRANEAAFEEVASAARELAVMDVNHAATVKAVALQMGYDGPLDADLIQHEIAGNMRRSVQACLDVGKGLRILKEVCQHGNFIARLEVLGLDRTVAVRFMQAATKFSNVATSHHLTSAIGTKSKLFELLILDEDQIAELELTGQTGELALDKIASMSTSELRAALRESAKEHAALDKRLEVVTRQKTEAEDRAARIAVESPDEELAGLKKEATDRQNLAVASVRGDLRQALIALRNYGDDDCNVFMAGLVGEVQVCLRELRDEFHLPDVSTAAEVEQLAEIAKWAPKRKG